MSMKSLSAPRRIYVRNNMPLVCYGGLYFGSPTNKESKIDADKTVRIEVLPKNHGKARISVTQGSVKEIWTEQKLTFAKRAA